MDATLDVATIPFHLHYTHQDATSFVVYASHPNGLLKFGCSHTLAVSYRPLTMHENNNHTMQLILHQLAAILVPLLLQIKVYPSTENDPGAYKLITPACT